MEGSNKQKLTPQEQTELIQYVLGSKPTTVEELKDGWANTAYRITMSDGTRFVMKLSPSSSTRLMRYESELMKTEVAVLNLLYDHRGIPVPKVIAFDESRTLVDGEFFIMEHLQGTPYNVVKWSSLTPEQRNRLDEQLGACTQRLHHITGTGFGPYLSPGPSTGSWKEAFTSLIHSVLDDGEEAGLPLPSGYNNLRMLIDEHSLCMKEVTVPALIHWDLWDGNVFVDEEEITGIIDFERALWADPLLEHYFSNTTIDANAFIRGYGRAQPFTSSEKLRIAYYKLYLDLIMYIECHYRGYTDEQHILWAKKNADEGIDTFVQAVTSKAKL